MPGAEIEPGDAAMAGARSRAEAYLAAFAEVCLARAGGDANEAGRESALELLRTTIPAEPELVAADQVAAAYRLSAAELELLVLLAAADRDYRIWAVARSFHRDPLRTGLDCAVSSRLLGRPVAELVDAAEALQRAELIVSAVPIAEAGRTYKPFTALFAHDRVVAAILGRTDLDVTLAGIATCPGDAPAIDELVLPAEVVESVRRALTTNASPPSLVLQGCDGIGKRALVLALARELGASVLVIGAHDLPHRAADIHAVAAAIAREARLSDAIIFVDDADAIADPERVQSIAACLAAAPRAVVLATTGAQVHCAPRDRSIARVDLSVPAEADREALWRRRLGDEAADLPAIAARYPISPGLISRAARSATMMAGGEEPGFAHVQEAVSSELAERFRSVGRRIGKRESWADLVLPGETTDAVVELLSRVRHRRRVLDDWGFGAKLAKGLGVSALFSGEPGTGKTMVASLIAEDLGLELYQIDLSTLVSKYIGETEKNLARAFDAAESGHAILLFDEADSLFGKRTDVKSSTDRYANMEVNYLLQRIEQFQGVAILTTNMSSSIDEAFVRRLSVHIRFELPEEAEREKLWQAMFPEAAPRADDIDFPVLAQRYEFSGGHIRNAVLRAAYLAGAEDGVITMARLRRAADLESQEMGRIVS